MNLNATLKFRVQEPGLPSRDIEVKEGLSFGRHPSNAVLLQDPKTSGLHAKVVRIDGALMIEDQGSTNKTRIENGPTLNKGERFSLIPGIKIFLGSTSVEVIGPADDGPLMTVLGTIVEPARPTAPPTPAPLPSPPAPTPPAAPVAAPTPAPAAAEPKIEKAPAEKIEKPVPPKPAVAPAAHGHGAAHAEAKKPSGIQYGEIDLGNASGTIVGKNVQLSGLAKEAAFRAARPRLVIVNEANRSIVEINETEFTIGRVSSADPQMPIHCVVSHGSLSSLHARISFNGRSFFLEDLGSKNGSFIGTESLAPRTPRELRPESMVRLGSVDFLFVTDTDAEGRTVPEAKYAAALDSLLAENKITKLQRMKAEQDAKEQKRHAGEMLLVLGVLNVEQWTDALSRSTILQVAKTAKKGGFPLVGWILGTIGFLALGFAVYYLYTQLEKAGVLGR